MQRLAKIYQIKQHFNGNKRISLENDKLLKKIRNFNFSQIITANFKKVTIYCFEL